MLIICVLDSIICVLYFFVPTRFSSKHQSFLLTIFLSMFTRFIFKLTRFLTKHTRYAKLVYEFYFTFMYASGKFWCVYEYYTLISAYIIYDGY